MDILFAEHLSSERVVNASIASWFQFGHSWRRVTEAATFAVKRPGALNWIAAKRRKRSGDAICPRRSNGVRGCFDFCAFCMVLQHAPSNSFGLGFEVTPFALLELVCSGAKPKKVSKLSFLLPTKS
jgi:hypothetical protein